MGIMESLIRLIMLSSAFGAIPVSLKLGPTSLSGYFTLLFSITAFMCCWLKPTIQKPVLYILFPILMFWIWNLVWFFGLIGHTKGLQNYPFVWGGLVFIIVVASKVTGRYNKNPKSFDRYFNCITWIYVLLLGSLVLLGKKDPATTQVGMIFFTYQLAKLYKGKHRSLIPVMSILFLQALSATRIVVIAEVFILIFGKILVFGYKLPRFFRIRISSLLLLGILFTGFILCFTSDGIVEKTLIGGDSAITIGNLSINTSGRLYWWKRVIESGLESPLIGNGKPGPVEMLNTPRWSHPHNDYLRLFHQSGLIGLALWLFFIFRVFSHNRKVARISSRYWEKILSHATFLIALGISIIMLTDNTLVYSYVMYPFAAMVGISSVFENGKKTRSNSLYKDN